MMSNEEKLEGLHNVSMKLLKKADEIFSKHGISYMLDAGTLLGAIRHKDFIPWDDDCDICMLREEYEKLLELEKDLPDGDFEMVVPARKGDDAFYDFVPKIIYKGVVIDKDSEDFKFYKGKYSYPALDIFVIDKVPETVVGQRLHTYALIFAYGLAMGHRREIDYSRYSVISSVVIRLLSAVGRFIPLHVEARLYDAIASMFRKQNKSKVMSTHSAMDHFGDVYEKEWYDGVCEGVIRNEKFPMPSGYEGILSKHYKNYMELPPQEKRVPKHISFDKIEFLRLD